MKEALKLALEALETERDIYRENDEDGAPEYILEAITVIEAALAASWGYRICEFCGCHTNAKARACCDAGRDADKALAQPVQEPWCMKMNGCTTKCEDCPDEPAQEPVAWMREDATLRFAEGKVFAVGQPFYTTPQQRPWVGLTFAEICDAEVVATDEFNYFSELKFARAIEAKLKEKNT